MSVVTASPDCYTLDILEQETLDTVDKLSVALGFIIALIIGGLIALGCAKLCLKDIMRYKSQDAESGYMNNKGYAPHEKEKVMHQKSSVKKRKKTAKQRLQTAKKKAGSDTLVVITPITLGVAGQGDQNNVTSKTSSKSGEEDVLERRGLADALVLPSGSQMEAEITNQDMDAINNLEKNLREENLNTMMALLRTLLNQQLVKGKITSDQYKSILQQYQDNVNDAVKTTQHEQEEEEEELRKKIKNKDELQRELDKLHPKYVQRLNSAVQEEREKFRKNLSNQTELSDQEIDVLMGQLAENMAALENKLGVERLRQAANLEERLAKRQQLAEVVIAEENLSKEEPELDMEAKRALLTQLVSDGKLTDRQCEELLSQYKEDQLRLQKKTKEDLDRQKLALAEKLRQKRTEQCEKLEELQEKQRDEFIAGSDQAQDPKALVEEYHRLLQSQRDEREELTDDLDQEEAAELNALLQMTEQTKSQQTDEIEQEFHQKLQTKAQLSEKEADRILMVHNQQKDLIQQKRQSDREKINRKLAEKREERRLKVEEDKHLALAEQKALTEQQDATLTKVLNSQVELSKEAKQKILKEHEHNMNSVNNQLQMSKLRQRKAMDQKLQARKAKVAELREKAEEVNTGDKDEKDKEKMLQQLEKELKSEESHLEAERSQAMEEMKERVAAETRGALEEQERQLGLLIARLQVGQARRQAIIQKQDKTIKQLEEQLSGKVASEVGAVHSDSAEVVDALINQHHSQVTELEDRMQEAKDRQDQLLQEKLQAKRQKKERNLEATLEGEAEEEWREQQRRGAGVATSIFSQAMLEQRHKMAMQQLEHELSVEMQKQREQLNKELEMELQQELEEQKKSFLAQLAAISNVSKAEMSELVDNAVYDAGGTEKEAKRLSKEMKGELQRAKSELGMDNQGRVRGHGRSHGNGYSGFHDDDDDYDERYDRYSRDHHRPPSGYDRYN